MGIGDALHQGDAEMEGWDLEIEQRPAGEVPETSGGDHAERETRSEAQAGVSPERLGAERDQGMTPEEEKHFVIGKLYWHRDVPFNRAAAMWQAEQMVRDMEVTVLAWQTCVPKA
jgi:hypothetical protein